MGPIGCAERSVIYYHSALRKIRKERRSCLDRGRSVKSPSDNGSWRGSGRKKSWSIVITMLRDGSDILVKICARLSPCLIITPWRRMVEWRCKLYAASGIVSCMGRREKSTASHSLHLVTIPTELSWLVKMSCALSYNFENRSLVSSCLSIRPSVRMQQVASHWTEFREVWHLSIFRKSI
jgi:hypothetical protein